MLPRLALLLSLAIHGNPQPVNRFHMVERNHTLDTLDQLIFWDWSPDYRRYHAQGWVLIRDTRQLSFRPPYRWLITAGPHAGAIIVSDMYRETWTRHDPERLNIVLFPECARRQLLR